ncbi:MAG: hypothetical protein V1838_03235 [Patescibacteria group bacterium]
MNIKKIGLDFGGVIGNHLVVKSALVYELFGLRVEPNKEATRSMLLPRLGNGEYERLAGKIGSKYKEIPLHDQALAVMTRMVNRGQELVIISMQHVIGAAELCEYVSMHGLPISSDNVCIVRTNEEKLNVAKAKDVSLYMDDNTFVLRLLEPLGIPLIWANFSDLLVAENNGHHVVTSWQEFESLVEKLSGRG